MDGSEGGEHHLPDDGLFQGLFRLVVEVTKQGHHHLCSLVIVVTTKLVESQLGMPAFFE